MAKWASWTLVASRSFASGSVRRHFVVSPPSFPFSVDFE